MKVIADFDNIYMFDPQQRIELIKRGVAARHIATLSMKMDVSKDHLMSVLGLSRATVNRKVRENKPLNQDESERVLGVESLIGQVDLMVRESGNPEGFDAAKWV